MGRALLVLNHDADRAKAMHWVNKAPLGTRIEFKASKRSNDQSAKMWAMLTEVAEQMLWHGQKLTPDDWKILFLDDLGRELRAVPALNGRGFVNLGRSSSDLSKQEMSDLIETIYEWGARLGVKFNDPQERAA